MFGLWIRSSSQSQTDSRSRLQLRSSSVLLITDYYYYLHTQLRKRPETDPPTGPGHSLCKNTRRHTQRNERTLSNDDDRCRCLLSPAAAALLPLQGVGGFCDGPTGEKEEGRKERSKSHE